MYLAADCMPPPDGSHGANDSPGELQPGDLSRRMNQYLEAIRYRFGESVFESGRCQDLALALLRASGNRGGLCACINVCVDEDGSDYGSTFSHMMYEDTDGNIWDIGGDDADGRWSDNFDDMSVPDKWGMTGRLDWVDVPCAEPDYADTAEWLAKQSENSGLDSSLQSEILEVIASVDAGLTTAQRNYGGMRP